MTGDQYSMQKSQLFEGIAASEMEGMLGCLGAKAAAYPKDSAIFLAGGPAQKVGLVLEGAVQVERDDVFGNRVILGKMAPGDLFGETFACAGVEVLPVSAVAAAACRVLLLDYRRVIRTCSSSCVFHTRLVENMLRILAGKNLMLNRKLEVLAARTTRDKLITYLAMQAGQCGKRQFTIPYNRQELADYLAVDRSALSREMSAMRGEGIIAFEKNSFTLLQPPADRG